MPHMAPLNAYTSRIADASESLILLLDRASGYLSARGNRAGAAMMAREAISLARQNVRVPPLEFARLLNNFAMFNSELGELDVAEAAFKEVLDITDKHLPSDDPRLAIAFSNVGGIHWKRKEFGRAEPHFLRALEILKANHREKTREYGTLLSNLGTLYSDWAEEPGEIARRKQEEEYKTAALAVTRAICGSRDPQMAVRLHNLAALRASQKNWPAAAAEAERSVSIMLSLELDEHPNMQQTVRLLILAWGQLGHQARAQRLKDGDTTDLLPTITEIEVEHRAWVAEDPERRHFGPPSPFGSEN
jgi:tetratricopeptide (TPR) repeat protein